MLSCAALAEPACLTQVLGILCAGSGHFNSLDRLLFGNRTRTNQLVQITGQDYGLMPTAQPSRHDPLQALR